MYSDGNSTVTAPTPAPFAKRRRRERNEQGIPTVRNSTRDSNFSLDTFKHDHSAPIGSTLQIIIGFIDLVE